jgi:hypothetical protein
LGSAGKACAGIEQAITLECKPEAQPLATANPPQTQHRFLPVTDRAAPYGPQTAQIRRFLQALAALRPETEVSVVARFGESSRAPAYRAAERALATVIAKSGRDRERDALGGPLLQMLRVPAPHSGEGADALSPATPPVTASGEGDTPTLRPIAEPALAALLALLMRDLLSAPHFSALYAPFDETISVATLG